MLKKIYIWLFMIVAIIVVILTGCDRNIETKNNSDDCQEKTSSEIIQQLTIKAIQENTGNNEDDIRFQDFVFIDNLGIIGFSYNTNQNLFFGIAVAYEGENGWEIIYFENPEVDKKQDVYLLHFNGGYPDHSNKTFHVTAGYINNSEIKSIILYYPNAVIKKIYLADDQEEFIDVNVNSTDSIIDIEYSSEGLAPQT